MAKVSDKAGGVLGFSATYSQSSTAKIKEGISIATALSDLLQIWGFESGFILFSDGSYGFGLALDATDVHCWDDSRIDAMADRLSMFLNALPTGLELQFVQDIGMGNVGVLDRNDRIGRLASCPTVQKLHQSRIHKLKKEESAGLIPKHELRLFIRRKPLARLLERPSFLSKPRAFEEIADHALERELTITYQLREEISRSLTSLDIKTRHLDENEVAGLLYRQWNPLRGVPLANYDPCDVRSTLLFTDVSLSLSGFSIGKMYHRVISLKTLPDQTFSAMAKILADLPFNSRLFLSIQVPDQQKEIEILQGQRRLAFSMARGKRSGVSDIESEAKFQDLESLLSEMTAQGEKIFHMSLNVLLQSRSEEDLEGQASQTLLKLREMAGAEGMEESLAAFDIFTEIALPNGRGKERSKRIKTSNLSDLLPLYGPWAGHESPRILLRSLAGNLISFDPFSGELSNYNHIVTGGSGSGKSFLTNILLLQLLKENPKVFIVDIGGSYRKLCDNLSGQYIPFSLSIGLSINPFDLIGDDTCPDGQKIKFLVGLVEMMTKEEGEVRVGRLERAEIEEAVQQVYRTCTTPRISDLRKVLLQHDSDEIRRLGKILTPWCGQSPFGSLLDRPTTVALQRSLVSFDLKGLESHPDLQAVCLYVITDYVWREVQRDKQTMKFLILDECWKLLESEAGSAFIGEVFRTFRKYYAGAIAISQNIDDFAKSRVSSAILPNTSIKWILMQKGANQARLQEVLQLNNSEMQLIASLYQERGVYSQAFLMAEDKHALVVIEPTALEYWIATTDPRDVSKIEQIQKLSPQKSQLQILTDLSELFPKGVVATEVSK